MCGRVIQKGDCFLNRKVRYLFYAVALMFVILAGCGMEYEEAATIERSEIEVITPKVEIADSTVQERSILSDADFTEIIESNGKGEGETNDERTGDGRNIHEGTEPEDSGEDDSGLSDSGRDIPDSPGLQEGQDAIAADGEAGEAGLTSDSGADAEYLYADNGAEQGTDADLGSSAEVGAEYGEDSDGVVENVITDEEPYYAEETYVEEEYLTYLGDYTISFYDTCVECCGSWSAYNTTASGREPIPWYTVASGSSLPFGTRLYIEGFGEFEVMDRGVSDGWIDILVNNHSEIPSYGITTASVYIIW